MDNIKLKAKLLNTSTEHWLVNVFPTGTWVNNSESAVCVHELDSYVGDGGWWEQILVLQWRG